MRESVGIPAGILAYATATIVLLIMVEIFLPNPREWANIITAATAFIAFKVTCAAVINFSSETGVKVVALMIAVFWVLSLGIDFFSYAEEVIDVLSAGQGSADSLGRFKELANSVWNTKVCAIVTAILAARTLAK